MRRLMILAAAMGAMAPSAGWAQLRVPTIVQRMIPATRGKQAQQPMLVGIDALRADFLAQSGSDTVYFAGDTAALGAPARTTLAAQAAWLRQHPEVVVQIEGHAATGDTRDHAMAVDRGNGPAPTWSSSPKSMTRSSLASNIMAAGST